MRRRHPLIEAVRLILGGGIMLTVAVLLQPQIAVVLLTLALIWLSYLLP